MARSLFILVFAFAFQSVCILAQADGTNVIVDGVRQGFWHVEGKNGKVDEGVYVDGKKDGIWKSFGIDGSLRSEITYVAGKAKGEAKFYDANGIILEEGFWNVDHWEGKYVRFNASGNKACEFNYDNRGRREGRQVYFHENGNVMYEGNWNEGKISGILTAYDPDGNKIMERNYSAEGKFLSVSAVEIPINASGEPPRVFTGTGNFTLYNTKGKIEKKGNFVKGELTDGEHFVYKEDGVTLSYIEEVSQGKVIKRK